MTYIIIVFLLVVLFVILAMRQPDNFRVARSETIDASAAEIFPFVNDQRKGQEWSPWFKLDPAAKITFNGPSSGIGAVSAWEGKKIGSGISTITESQPNELVKMRLEFLKPFKATNTAEFTLQPAGTGTSVSWIMYGHNNFMAKVMSLFMNCEKMVGPQFAQGLLNLKALVEKK